MPLHASSSNIYVNSSMQRISSLISYAVCLSQWLQSRGRIVRYHGPASFRHAPAASAEGLAWDRSSEPAITRARVWVRTRSRKELEGSEFARTAR
jgi:hypothetical protein